MTAFPSRTTMRVHYFQHVPFEGLGSIASWLSVSGATVTCTKFFGNPVLPDLEGIDMLVVVGGPMSINNDTEFPWLTDEKAFIRRAFEAGRAVVGICLGALLIASALGARVYPNKEKEIGWFPIFSMVQPLRTFSFASRRQQRCSTGMERRLSCRLVQRRLPVARGAKTRLFNSARESLVCSFIWRPHNNPLAILSHNAGTIWSRPGTSSPSR